VKSLLDFPGIDVNKLTTRGTALHIACKMGSQGMVRLLIARKADPYMKNLEGQNSYQVSNR
jgi:ankyrin repeat protein